MITKLASSRFYEFIYHALYFVCLVPIWGTVLVIEIFAESEIFQASFVFGLLCFGMAWRYARRTAKLLSGERFYSHSEAVAETFRGPLMVMSMVPVLGLLVTTIIKRMPPSKRGG